MADSRDIGRRLARRREQLGLSAEQVANRAGIPPSFVELLEQQPVAVASSAVVRLAAALLMTPEKLLGDDLPDGQGRAAPHPRLEPLGDAECLRLIAPGGVGRIGYVTDTGPELVPVNYVLTDDQRAVVFRTRAEGVLIGMVDDTVGFEVDRIDEARRAGWSVLVSGRLRRLALPASQLKEFLDVTPWAGGDRDTYLRIEIERVSGRRIVPGAGQP